MNNIKRAILSELDKNGIKSAASKIKLAESIYNLYTRKNLSVKEATTCVLNRRILREDTHRARKTYRYEVIYLPYHSERYNDPEKDVSQLKVFNAPDDWTAMVYAIALVSAERENYFKDNKNISRAAAKNYVYDFLYPESFPTGINKNHISLATLYDMLQDTQNDDGTGNWVPETDYGYIFSLTREDGNVLYEGDLDPHDWNYESFFWWHDGKHSKKYSAYMGNDEVLEDHLPKRRF